MQKTEVRRAPHRHPPFTELRMNAIHQIRGMLGEVYLLSVEEWEDNLRRDFDPDAEIRRWLHLARVYAEFTVIFPVESHVRQDIFRVLVCLSLTPPTRGSRVRVPNTLTSDFVRRLIVAYYCGSQSK